MCPHFGLIDENNLKPEEIFLMRARLHWRCGLRRLRESKHLSGIATLYDALLSGMRWHIMTDPGEKSEGYSTEALENERYVFNFLRKKGIIDHTLNIRMIEDFIDRALDGRGCEK